MYTVETTRMRLTVDFAAGHVTSLLADGTERIAALSPLFRLRLRHADSTTLHLTAYNAATRRETNEGGLYTDFADAPGLTLRLTLKGDGEQALWSVEAEPGDTATLVEWIDFPLITLPALRENCADRRGGQILLPYNEGVLISDAETRQLTDFRFWDPEYPSIGCYSLFPNMISSQMLACLWEDCGLYLGAHDPARGVKSVDFYPDRGGVTPLFRLFCGVDFGKAFRTDYPIVWRVTDNRWESAAEIYRAWFETHLPPRVRRIAENPDLPAWYADSPLVVSYPVRGIHDMDEMYPNALFPYVNALPLLDSLREAAESRLLVLLMHWEGTAPWAPPYVWPPYGGVEGFEAFRSALRERGDLLGVYCSGFGYTLRSNLIPDYDRHADCAERSLERGMCAGPDGKVAISRICTGQRKGYDVCPASPVGHDLLAEAYAPLFESGLDYVQILDQNHGGSQYFCYSRDHGHPPAPGAWMTEHMQTMLTEWNRQAPGMLFGCESAAAEPFIGNLLFSDNRFELNYLIGTPVPLYAYLYHPYVRNFMGNQVSCHLKTEVDTLRYRMAYSFSAGDCMTLVLTPDGDLMNNWGTRDFIHKPDREAALRMVANLSRLYREEAKPYLYDGRMIPAPAVACDTVSFDLEFVPRKACLPAVLSSAWESTEGKRAVVLVNPGKEDALCRVEGRTVTVPALDGLLLEL